MCSILGLPPTYGRWQIWAGCIQIPQQKELDFWYPTTTLVTGFDIIFFWVARMIMASLELYGEDKNTLCDEEIAQRLPFKKYLHSRLNPRRKGT